MKNINHDSTYLIKAVDLKKTYVKSDVQAVAGNTFAVKKGEVFGLLGPNGAGKSTTFGMMCMETPKNSGVARVLNKRVEEIDVLKDGPYIGLCPQYNAIWEQLTVDESLNLVARMKGLSTEDRDRNKKLITETLELTEFTNTRAGTLSGGNKRKLCVA